MNSNSFIKCYYFNTKKNYYYSSINTKQYNYNINYRNLHLQSSYSLMVKISQLLFIDNIIDSIHHVFDIVMLSIFNNTLWDGHIGFKLITELMLMMIRNGHCANFFGDDGRKIFREQEKFYYFLMFHLTITFCKSFACCRERFIIAMPSLSSFLMLEAI